MRYADMLAAQGDQIAAEGRRLSATLAHLTATCREYPLGQIAALGDRVQSLDRRDAEIAGWARGVAEAFVAADSPPIIATLQAWHAQADQFALNIVQRGEILFDVSTMIVDVVAWNKAAKQLLEALQFINATTALSGDQLWGTGLGVDLAKVPLGASLLAIGGLILLEDGPRWFSEPVDSPDDGFNLLEQGFWILAFHRVAPDLLLALSAEIEELNRRTSAERGAGANPRPAKFDETNLTPQQVFPDARPDPATGDLALPAWSVMDGDHRAISAYQDEQISLFRIGQAEYLFAICGLDLTNMAVSPNGMTAVILTANEPDPMANPYYRLIKARFMAYLAQIPPGSTINMTGHSMGGGMTMLLLNDPEVQAAMVAGSYTLRSVVLYGAVRPLDPQHNGVPPSQPSALSDTLLTGTEVRIYVDTEDKLALNVGAGHMVHADQAMPNVHMLDNGKLDGATTAHTSYDNPTGYADLPTELQELPFHVDPRYWEHTRSPDMGDVRPDAWRDRVGLVGAPQTPAAA